MFLDQPGLPDTGSNLLRHRIAKISAGFVAESGHVVTDEEVWEVQRRIAHEEGIFTEPAGAVALAGALRAVRKRRLAPDAHVICMITGSGFKDPHSVEESVATTAGAPLVSLDEFSRL